MRRHLIGLAVLALTCAIAALMAPAALAKTYLVDPRIADTTAESPCTSPCALRQALHDAQQEEELNFGPIENTIELAPGTYTLTDGPLQVAHPFGGTEEQTTTLIGAGGYAHEVLITADGSSRVLTDGNDGGTSGTVLVKRVEITGGNGTGGNPEVEGQGGGIVVEQNGDLTLEEDLIVGNTAPSSGGGVQDDGQLRVEDSTIANNTVSGGAGVGGGVASENVGGSSRSVTILNSTVAGNSVTGGSENQGGGIYDGTTLTLESSTVAGNSAPSSGGGGLASFEGGSVGVSTLANNVLASNAGGDCAGMTPTSLGGNLADDASCAIKAAGDKQSVDPLLVKALGEPKVAENGGATPTVELQPSSPAIAAGETSHCQALDQRGFARATPCTSGAFEYGASESPGTFVVSGSSAPSAGGTVAASGSAGRTVCAGASCTADRRRSHADGPRQPRLRVRRLERPGVRAAGLALSSAERDRRPRGDSGLQPPAQDHRRSRPCRAQRRRDRFKPDQLLLGGELRSGRRRHRAADRSVDRDRAAARMDERPVQGHRREPLCDHRRDEVRRSDGTGGSQPHPGTGFAWTRRGRNR